MCRRARLLLAVAMLGAGLTLPAAAAQAGALQSILAAYSAGGGTIPACEFSSAELNAALGEIGHDTAQYGAALIGAIRRALSVRRSGGCHTHATTPTTTTTTPTNTTTTPKTTTTPTTPKTTTTPATPTTPTTPKTTTTPTTPTTPKTTTLTTRPTTTRRTRPTTRRTITRRTRHTTRRTTTTSTTATTSAVAPPPAPPSSPPPGPRSGVPARPVTSATGAEIPAPMLILGGVAAVLAAAATVVAVGRLRGWDPAWAAGMRHAWHEAGYRSAGAWAEFSDWLRFGRS